MEDLDYASIIKEIEKKTKKSYEAHEGKNLANLGGKVGDVVKLERNGEYYGISVELLEDVKPLLTKEFVVRILWMLKKEDYITPLGILHLASLDELHYIINEWLKVATTICDNSFVTKKKFPAYANWIKTVTHDPINVRIRVVDIGCNTTNGSSVLPEDWVGREFDNAFLLHQEMDTLPSRVGKAPTTYAVIYAMEIQVFDTCMENIKNIKYKNIIYLDWDNKFIHEITKKERKDKYEYVKYDDLLIGFRLRDILEPKVSTNNNKDVGVLVSRLQKAIRRGRYGSNTLIETIDKLNISANYNLPEHQFMRTSASKQLVWRLFITILEDCRPYQPNDDIVSLFDLMLLTLITQKVQEYKFTPPILEAIKRTALLTQYNDTILYDWRNLDQRDNFPLTKNHFQNAVSLALNHMIMMSGDRYMLSKYYSLTDKLEPFDIPTRYVTNNKIEKDILLASYDMHNKTAIILYYQACVLGKSTREISNYIWDCSSGYNVRDNVKQKKDSLLRDIQKYFYIDNEIIIKDKIQHNNFIMNDNVSECVKRTSFLILFGMKFKHQKKEVIIAGTFDEPLKVKVKNEWVYSNETVSLASFPKSTISLNDIAAPFGYKWVKNKVIVSVIDSKFYVDGNVVPLFDGSSLLQSITPIVTDKYEDNVVYDLLNGKDVTFEDILYFRCDSYGKLVDWMPSVVDEQLLMRVYTKLFNQVNDIIMIGPVDRSGNKMQNAIDYYLEGRLWAIFNLCSYFYPDTFKISGALNFKLKRNTPGYVHLIMLLERVLFCPSYLIYNKPIITTKLWDHQLSSVTKIVTKFKQGTFGYGNASGVGAGKTLTSIQIGIELIKMRDTVHSGILVLVPNDKLIDTWVQELEEHTSGFDIIIHSTNYNYDKDKNNTFVKNNKNNVKNINTNTIVISTMGRNRDHYVYHKWLLVIVDECLTVQNKNALWTEAAWRQALMSKHLLMMSATFYRTRFDKLYYMLKMLRSGLPEKKEYLDTILSESIVSQVPETGRVWTSYEHYFTLDNYDEYNDIARSDKNTDIKFAELTSYLVQHTKKDVVKQLRTLISEGGGRCLIYARAKEEAEYWSNTLLIPQYPEKGQHCIVTYHNGTYGLNDLVEYDTIIMRPPQPDCLPQIKGRLDRPGQDSKELTIHYFVLKDTIEEGLLLRLNIASQFVHKYIMPLSTFYDISINYDKYK